MFLQRKSNVIFRRYDTFGYVADGRNFGYRKIGDDENHIGDKVLSDSGAVFFSVLDKEPKSIEVLTNEIKKQFIDVDVDIIKNDLIDFYSMLECDGFVVSGSTVVECKGKDYKFSYAELGSKIVSHNLNGNVNHSSKSTQDFLGDYFNGAPQLTSVHIEITSKCNERCIHCYIPHEDKNNSMDSSLFYSILKQCKDMNVLHLTISGGEPMLHKDFCGFLKKCKEYEFSVNILSNLTLLDNEILNEMKENPLLGVQVSLYSMSPSVHDAITKSSGSFEKTKNAILKLIENNIPLQISCPVIKQNANCYNDVVQWAREYNVHASDDMVIIAGSDHESNNLNCRLPINEVKEILINKASDDSNYLRKIKQEYSNKKEVTENDAVCSVCSSSVCITEKGDIYPCAGWQSYVIANLEGSTLSDIWSQSEKIRYLRSLTRHDFPKCLKCINKEYCTMCMVRNANESPVGDPLTVNEYFCHFAAFNKEIILGNIEHVSIYDNP